MPNPTSGTMLGAYQVEGVIGAGSMGDVFRGHDTGLNRRVAIKILSEKHRDSPELRARFTREGRAVAAIQHPNVVQVFATGTYDERPYIAMELLEGTDLGSVIDDNGPLAGARAARAILDAAKGLQAAAKAGLIHRDVKPSNLVLLDDGRVKVTDFGLAKPVDPGSEPSLTALGVVVGTPDYIAPEQARGDAIDERVDIYALGGTLYYLIIGTPPFRTGKPAEDKYLKVVARHLRQPPPNAKDVNPAIDTELAELARQMMAKKPAERPGYPELVAKLERIVTRLESGVRDESPIPRGPEGSGGLISKTPFVGGDTPNSFIDDAGEVRGGNGEGDGDAAPTGVRLSAAEQVPYVAPDDDGDGDLAEPGPAPGLPSWVWLVTLAAAGMFAVGLVAYLMRGTGASGAAPGTIDAAATAVTGAADAAAPADARPDATGPAVPTGMLLVTHPDGKPWFYVDAAPVSDGAYAAVFTKRKRPAAAAAAKPAFDVAYTFARAYGQTVGKRLVRADEWDAAAATAGFVEAGPDAWEWVDAGAPGKAKNGGETRTVKMRGKTANKPPAAAPDITFRLAVDP